MKATEFYHGIDCPFDFADGYIWKRRLNCSAVSSRLDNLKMANDVILDLSVSLTKLLIVVDETSLNSHGSLYI